MFTFILCNCLMYTYIAYETMDWYWMFPIEQWGFAALFVLFLAEVVFVLPVLLFRLLLGTWVNYFLIATIVYFATGVNVI